MSIFDLEKNKGKDKIEVTTSHGTIVIHNMKFNWYEKRNMCIHKKEVKAKRKRRKKTVAVVDRPSGLYCDLTDKLCNYDNCPRIKEWEESLNNGKEN